MREREVKRLKLRISLTDRESEFISTSTDNPPVGEHTVYGHILGLPTNITIYNLLLSYTMIYCMNQQIFLPITDLNIDEEK